MSGVIATRAEVGADGRYTGELQFYAYGEGKAEAVRAVAQRTGIDLSRSFAYSDSVTDLPLLEAVGNPVAVTRTKELRKVAEEHGWPIRDFHQPVRLRTRIASAAGPRASVAAALAAAGIAAMLVWVVFRSRAAGRRAASTS